MPVATAPASLYSDPEVFALERRGVFARAWLFFGLDADLAQPGDFLADEVADYPVVVVRTESGELHGFHNVCRHRAGPLVGDARGHCDREFVCRYHGWRYALDGRLRSATGFGPSEGFDPRDFSLFPVRVETWRGFVFVNLDPEAAPLIETLGPLDVLFGNRAVPQAVERRSHALACNWKVYVENYLEGYHIDQVHPGLAADIDAQAYAVRMEGQVAVHEVPSSGGAAEGLWAWVWPNLAFNLYRGVLLLEHIRPVGHGQTRLDYVYLHEAGDPAFAAALATSGELTREDAWICQRVQQNLDAGVYQGGVLSPRHENAVGWFQARISEAIAA